MFGMMLRRLGADRRGASAVEYGLIAASVALVIMLTVTPIGTNLSTIFSSVGSQLGNLVR
jgi:pilus assembly protein Flp/PilA